MNAPLTAKDKFEEANDPCRGCDLSCSGCAYTGIPLYMKIKLSQQGWDTHAIGRRTKLEEAKQKLLEGLIPPGPYCYVIDITKPKQPEEDGAPVVYCPHFTNKEFNGVNVPWCNFVNKGGTSNNHNDEDWAKLVEKFGSDDNVFDFLPLDLLWDACKECGAGGDYNYSEEDLINWINEVKEYEG